MQRFLAGETKTDLGREFDLSSPKLVETWARTYCNDGEDGLRPKPKGRPRTDPNEPAPPESTLALSRRENERLGAENATWEKCWP